MTREMTVLDIVKGYEPKHEIRPAAAQPEVGEGTRLIAVPLPPRADVTRVIDFPTQARAPIPPAPQPVAPVSWWKALLMRVRAALS